MHFIYPPSPLATVTSGWSARLNDDEWPITSATERDISRTPPATPSTEQDQTAEECSDPVCIKEVKKKEEIDASSIYSSYWPCSVHIPHRWTGSKVGRPRVGKLRWPSARGRQRSPCRKPCWPWETLHRTSHSSAPTLKWWKMITGNEEEKEKELRGRLHCTWEHFLSKYLRTLCEVVVQVDTIISKTARHWSGVEVGDLDQVKLQRRRR